MGRWFDSPRLHHFRSFPGLSRPGKPPIHQALAFHAELPGLARPFPSWRRFLPPVSHGLALALAGCAAGPTFVDAPTVGPARSRVLVESRVADEATVKATCYWKAREAGVRLFEGSPGCSFVEDGQRVILWVPPRSFSDRLPLEVAGHELLHQHNTIDHR